MEPQFPSNYQADINFLIINPSLVSISINNSNKFIRKVIEIKNVMVFPVIYKLRTSDSRALDTNKKSIRINSNKTEKIELIFKMDFLRSRKNIENETHFVHFESDAYSYKYSIFFNKNKFTNSNNINSNPTNNNHHNAIEEKEYNHDKQISDINKNVLKIYQIYEDKLENEIEPNYDFDGDNFNTYKERNYETNPNNNFMNENNASPKDLRNKRSLNNSFDVGKSNRLSQTNVDKFTNYNYNNNSTKELNNIERDCQINTNDVILASTATFSPTAEGRESFFSSFNSKNSELSKNKNHQINERAFENYHINYPKEGLNENIASNNTNFQNSSNFITNSRQLSNEKFNRTINSPHIKKYSESGIDNLNDYRNDKAKLLEKYETNIIKKENEFKSENYSELDPSNNIYNQKDYLETVSTQVMKERILRLLFTNYEKNKKDYAMMVEIIEFMIKLLNDLEAEYSEIYEIRRVKNTDKTNKYVKVSQGFSKSFSFSSQYKQQGNKLNENMGLTTNKDEFIENEISEKIKSNKMEVIYIRDLIRNFLKEFSWLVEKNYSQHKQIYKNQLENTDNIPYLTEQQIDYIYKEIQNLDSSSNKVNSYKIQIEKLILNIESMKKTMKDIIISVEEYKYDANKAQKEKEEADLKIKELQNHIKLKDEYIENLKQNLYEFKGKFYNEKQIYNYEDINSSFKNDNIILDYEIKREEDNKKSIKADHFNKDLNLDLAFKGKYLEELNEFSSQNYNIEQKNLDNFDQINKSINDSYNIYDSNQNLNSERYLSNFGIYTKIKNHSNTLYNSNYGLYLNDNKRKSSSDYGIKSFNKNDDVAKLTNFNKNLKINENNKGKNNSTIENLMLKKLNTNKQNLSNLIDDLKFSKNEFLKNNDYYDYKSSPNLKENNKDF